MRRHRRISSIVAAILAHGNNPPPYEPTVADLKMIGGQPWNLYEYTREPFSNDIMRRARGIAAPTGQYYEYPTTLWVTSVTRSSNVTTVVVQTNTPLNDQPLYTGQKLTLTYFFDSSFNVDGVELTRVNNTTFTYPNTGADTSTITMANIYDCPAFASSRVAMGAAGHPIEDFNSLIMTVSGGTDTQTPELAGTYLGVFPGSAPTGFTCNVGGVLSGWSSGGSTFTMTINNAATNFLQLNFTGVPTDGTFRMPQIVRNDHPQSNPPFLRADTKLHYGRFTGGIRTMDMNKTNLNGWVRTWANRPRLNHGSGVPLEDMVKIANELNVDLWYIIPTLADDDYVDQAAAYIRDNLNPSLNCYFEYSNEIWNAGMFPQWHWVNSMARLELQARHSGFDNLSQIVSVVRNGSNQITVTLSDTCPYTVNQHVALQLTGADTSCNGTNITITGVSGNTFTYTNSGGAKTFTFSRVSVYGNLSSNLLTNTNWDATAILERMAIKKVYLLSQRIKTVFSGVLNGRARMVFMWQLALFQGVGSNPWDQIEFIVSTYGALKNWCWGIGGAPYATCTGGSRTPAQVLADMIASVDSDMKPPLHQLKYMAVKHEVKAMNYEGGPDTQGLNTASTDTLWESDQMRQAQEYCLNSFLASGVDLHMIFNTSLRWHGYNGDTSWGVGNTLAEVLPVGNATNPKAKAFDNVLGAAPPALADRSGKPFPGTITLFSGGGSVPVCDGFSNSFITNGMCRLYNANSYVEEMRLIPPGGGNYSLNIWGKCLTGGHTNGVRIYVDGVLQGSLALATGSVSSGAAGGDASPTSFTVALTAGYHTIKLTCPVDIPDELGVSKIVVTAV